MRKLRQDTNDITEERTDDEREIEEETGGNETDNISSSDSSASDSPTPVSTSTTKRIGSVQNGTGDGWKNYSMKAIVPTNRSGYQQMMDVNGLRAFLDTIDVASFFGHCYYLIGL